MPLRVRTIAKIVLGLSVGVILVAMALSDRTATEPLRGGMTTTGVVQSTAGSKLTFATIDFTDASGRKHEFHGPGETFSGVSEGDQVRVSYLPTHPSTAHDLSAQTLWPWSLGLGALFCLVALWGGAVLLVDPAPRHTAPVGGRHVSVNGARFTAVRWRESYDIDEVDAFLARIAAGSVTSAEAKSVQFRPVRLGWGYAMNEVDGYLSGVEETLRSSGH